ncbi:expressed protein [Baffinella frigidus]|nr:expressed protein [Cryptophyta sp. CCMP2293]
MYLLRVVEPTVAFWLVNNCTSVQPLQLYNSTTLQRYNATTLQLYNSTTPQLHNSTTPQLHNSTTLQLYNFGWWLWLEARGGPCRGG